MTSSIALLLSALIGAIGFDADWAAFRAGGDSSRVEFFYAIPYDQLAYTSTDSGLVAEFAVKMTMIQAGGDFREEGTLRKRARLASFEEARRLQRTFVDGFSVVAPPGRYRYELAVSESSGAAVNRGTVADSLELAGFRTGLALSSLQLGASAVVDSATGAVSVVPTPGHRFRAGLEALYVYFEGYSLDAESGHYQVRFSVCRRGAPAETLVVTPPLRRSKSGTTVASALGVNVESLKPGSYMMTTTLTDLATGRSVTSEKGFAIVSADGGESGVVVRLDQLTERERRYYQEIQYVASANEYKRFQALSDSGKQAYLAWFWTKHNLTEFARRMETADEKFHYQRTAGTATDRGRIYVKYGQPDAIEQKVIETDIRPREYWSYYGTGNIFVFIDIRSDGNYRLAFTNSKGEPKTGLEHYLTNEELDQWGN